MAALREIFASFGIEFDREGKLKIADKSTNKLTEKLKALGVMLGAGLVARGVARFVGDMITAGDELDKTARRIGLTTAQFQAFSHAAALGGVDSAALSTSIAQLQQRAYEAANGGAEARKMFTDLGASFQGTNGELLTGSQLMRNVADGLRNQTNSSRRTALAMKLMGEQGTRLLPMFEGGAAGLDSMTAELDRLGGGASQTFIDRSVEMNDDLTRFRLALTSLKSAFLLQFLPSLDRGIQGITRWTAELSRNERALNLVKIGLGIIGVIAASVAAKVAIAWLAAGWPIVLVAVAVGVLGLVLDDLWTTWQGGDSITRQFINEIWPGMVDGLDATDRAILAVTETISAAIAIFESLGAVASYVGDIIASAFRPVTVLIGAVRDISSGRGAGSVVSRALGRLTHSDITGRSTWGENPAEAEQNARREAMVSGINRIGRRIAGGGPDRRERSLTDRMLPEHLQRTGLGNQRRVNETNQTVQQEISIAINADGISDPNEVMAIARREMREELGRHAREVQAQLVPQRRSQGSMSSQFEWEEG